MFLRGDHACVPEYIYCGVSPSITGKQGKLKLLKSLKECFFGEGTLVLDTCTTSYFERVPVDIIETKTFKSTATLNIIQGEL